MPFQPVMLNENNIMDIELWRMHLQNYQSCSLAYSNSLAGLYRIVLGQCIEALNNKLRAHNENQSTVNI
jgi:hypothetical protein